MAFRFRPNANCRCCSNNKFCRTESDHRAPDSPASRFEDSPAFKWLTGIGIPVGLTLGIALAGWLITTSIERAKIDSDYVRIALSILTPEKHAGKDQDSDKPQDSEMALRGWAVRLLNARSPEAFTPAEQEALLKDGLRNPQLLLSTLSAFRANQLSSVPGMLSASSYAGGAFLLIKGGLKMKARSENANNGPMSAAVARLNLGPGLTAAPAFLKMLEQPQAKPGQLAKEQDVYMLWEPDP